jgi:hypothetical protein
MLPSMLNPAVGVSRRSGDWVESRQSRVEGRGLAGGMRKPPSFFLFFALSREVPDPCFLDCGGLIPLWIFPSTRSIPTQSPVKPEHSKTPSLPQNALGNCGTLSQPLRAFASSRETPTQPPPRLRVRPFRKASCQTSTRCPQASRAF